MGLSKEHKADICSLKPDAKVVLQVAVGPEGGVPADFGLSALGGHCDQVVALAAPGRQVVINLTGAAARTGPLVDIYTTLLLWKGLKVNCISVLEELSSWHEKGVAIVTTSSAAGTDFFSVSRVFKADITVVLWHALYLNTDKGRQFVEVYTPGTVVSDLPEEFKHCVECAWSLAQTGGVVVLCNATDDALGNLVAGVIKGTIFSPAAVERLHTHAAQSNGHSAAPAASSSSRDMAVRARAASRKLQALTTADREAMLHRIADALLANEELILAENAKDVEENKGKISEALLQRLILKPQKISQLAEGCRAIAAMEEPIGRLISKMELAEGLILDKRTAPIGVLLIIFEARPDALPQIASLALRSGNGLLLKGGKEAAHSNAVLHRVITQAIGELGPDLIGLITTRDEINDLLKLDDVIDLVIPRGGNALVTYIQHNTKIAVLGHADGICHIYVHEDADLDMAAKVVVDAKADYCAACNAVEKVLLHSSHLKSGGLTRILGALQAAGVEVFAGKKLQALQASGQVSCNLAPAASDRIEYSELALTLEVVEDMGQAIDHIHAYGSSHTDCIITQSAEVAETFLRSVDSACVFVNASTRFADGFRFGLGAEVGISTSRIHARGPVGVEGLLTTKWLLRGSGHVVSKDKGVSYTHRRLPLEGQ